MTENILYIRRKSKLNSKQTLSSSIRQKMAVNNSCATPQEMALLQPQFYNAICIQTIVNQITLQKQQLFFYWFKM